MLKKLRLYNFRGFSEHELPLTDTTIIVGRNNSGKSTIVEALKLVSIVTNRCTQLLYRDPPTEFDIPRRYVGVRPSLKGLNLELRTICHRYADPPSQITADFTSGEQINIFVHPDDIVFATITDASGQIIRSKSQARSVNLPKINILPQVTPLTKEERILEPEYVRNSLSSYLSSQHFRNQLNLFYDNFKEFSLLAERTWPGLRIRELEGQGRMRSTLLNLYIQDGPFVAEVAWMGHGLQVWLQTVWFLSRISDIETIILDEPDVYLHADLQRKLVRLLKVRRGQKIIATHSVEIMSETSPEEILIAERNRPKSKFAASLSAVQRITDNIGSVHNVHLARLSTSRKLLLVEGKDLSILKCLQNTIFPESQDPLGAIPNMSINGWTGWPLAIGSKMLLRNEVGELVRVYCLLDSDYHTPEEIEERIEEARIKSVYLHIWKRKELENYLIIPAVIERVVNKNVSKGKRSVREIEIENRIFEICDQLKVGIIDTIAEEVFKQERKRGLKGANRAARERVRLAWETPDGRIGIVPGKKLLSQVSKWSQDKCGVSLSAIRVVREIRPGEIPEEMRDIIERIERLQGFQL